VWLSICLISVVWPSQSWGHSNSLPDSNFWRICLRQSLRKSSEEAEMIAGEIILFSDSLVAARSEAARRIFPCSSAETWKDIITLFLPKQYKSMQGCRRLSPPTCRHLSVEANSFLLPSRGAPSIPCPHKPISHCPGEMRSKGSATSY